MLEMKKKINKQVKNFSERLTNIMDHVKNRQAGTEDKAEEQTTQQRLMMN